MSALAPIRKLKWSSQQPIVDILQWIVQVIIDTEKPNELSKKSVLDVPMHFLTAEPHPLSV